MLLRTIHVYYAIHIIHLYYAIAHHKTTLALQRCRPPHQKPSVTREIGVANVLR